MVAAFDVNLFPIARFSGRDNLDQPGLLFKEPPRRSARGRNRDRLILCMFLGSQGSLTPDQQDEILADLAKLYYHTSGSITAGLRKTAEELNAILLERNRQLGANRQVVAYLGQIVLREDRLTIAQSGPLHGLFISSDGVTHIYDPENSGAGLGLARTALMSFAQVTLKTNDTLILTENLPAEWTSTALTATHGQGPESLRRKLFQQTRGDLSALALQAKPGKGKFLYLRPGAGQVAEKPAVQVQERDKKTAIPSAQAPQLALSADLKTVVEVPEIKLKTPEVISEATGVSVPAAPQTETQPTPAGTVSAIRSPSASEQQKTDSASRGVWYRELFTSLGKAWSTLGKRLRTGLSRMLPGEAFLKIPSGVMALIALVVPAVIVTASSVVYIRLGRTAQYDLFSSQARQAALGAMEQTDLGEKRAGLGMASSLLKKAEAYAGSPESLSEVQTMKAQVRAELDALDYIRRVFYVPAIVGGLPMKSNIVRMAAYDDEIYMLDGETSRVLRAQLTNQGYEIDYSFVCEPGNYGETGISKIVDIFAWPTGYKPNAKVLAVDSTGNLLFCQPNQAPEARKITKPVEVNGWGEVLGAALDQGDFYLLDLPSNGVWIYWRSNFSEQPTLFFDQDIPDMKDVSYMLVDRDDLYLLQSNGNMMLCVRNTLEVAPTRCAVQSYLDRRPGRENMPLLPPSPFTQILSSQPPDPSLYLLEPASQAFYHFSLRNLAFQKMYLPDNPLPAKRASAFTINTNLRYLYLALGNQIYYAVMP